MSPPGAPIQQTACREASNRVWRQLAAEALTKANVEVYGFRVRSLVATWKAQGLSVDDVRDSARVQRRGDLIVVRSKPSWPWRLVSR